MKFSINILISLFILVLVSACDSSGGGGSPDPSISSFKASSTTIAHGSSVDLTFEFVGGTGEINNGVGVVTSGTAVSVSPATTTTYMLTVTDSSGGTAVTSFVTVTVLPAIIESFSATLTTIVSGDSVDLTAAFVTDGTASIDNGIGTVATGWTQTVSPVETTTYTLTVTNSLGESVSSAITVSVAALNSLSILNQDFDGLGFLVNQTDYTATVGYLAKSIQIKATSADASANITVEGVAIAADDLSHLVVLAEGITVIDVVVTQNTVSKTYTLTITRQLAASFAEQAYIKSSNTDGGDEFGYRVALSGDTLAVGAHFEASSTTGIDSTPDELATHAGAVYVFVRDGGGSWTQQAYIKSSNSEEFDEFGISVALYGDTLAVGAIGEDSSTTGVGTISDEDAANSGAVYVFARNGSSWSEQAYIKASNTGATDEFGISVALSGDTLAVGAHQEDSSTSGVGTIADDSAANSGAVYVFTRNGSAWSEQAYIKASNTGVLDTFGISVALSGDTLAVGADGEDSSTTGVASTPDEAAATSGAVYVFTRSDASWSEQAYIKASNTGKSDEFGISVALSGDTLAVGAWLEDSDTTGVGSTPNEAAKNSGAVYVFARNGTSWAEQAYIKSSNTQSNDVFGYSVALSGDILAIGAYGEDSASTGIDSTPDENASLSGAVYVLARSGTSWSEQSYIKASNAGAFDWFGYNVALAADTIAVGAYLEESSTTGVGSTPDDAAANAGAVYVFE